METDQSLKLTNERRWGTPILVSQLDESVAEPLNAALRREILEMETTEKPLTVGVQSAGKFGQQLLTESDRSEVSVLQDVVTYVATEMGRHVIGPDADALLDDYVAEAWAVVYRSGGNHRIHHHPGSLWSAVYYVSCSADDEGGQLELIDPRPAALANRGGRSGTVKLKPKPGMVVGFPSWLQHNVTPLLTSNERICVAFNVGLAREVAH